MAYQIKQSKLFLSRLTKLLIYLEGNWSKRVAYEFKKRIDERMLELSINPDIGRDCKVPNVKRLLIIPHNKLFYRVKGKTIYIITLFDMRQNPYKNKYE